MDLDDLCHAGAFEQSLLIQAGEISAVELLEATLGRIEETQPTINAFRCVLADEAMAQAHELDASQRSDDTRPLLGVPVGIKDTLDVAGQITTAGSAGFETVAPQDDPLVAALRNAGAIIVGKTTSSELAVWPFTETEAWGQTRNPWNTEFSTGGSSGGSGAAAAAGLCGLAVGSDGLGSIRVPAGFCGVFGLKPQRGRVFHSELDWNGMSVNGPLTRSVRDAAAFLDAATSEGGFLHSIDEPHRPLRIALAWKPLVGYPMVSKLGDEQRQAVVNTAEVLRGLGHEVVEHSLNFSKKASSNGMIRYFAGIHQGLNAVEHPDRISKRTRTMARIGGRIPGKRVESARNQSAEIAQKLNQVFENFDVVLTPGAVQQPTRIGELDGMGAISTLRLSGNRIPYTGIWNVVGQPCASVPAGFDSDGLPLSVLFGARPNDEHTLLRLAAELELAQPWADERPI